MSCTEHGCIWPVAVIYRTRMGRELGYCAHHWRMFRDPGFHEQHAGGREEIHTSALGRVDRARSRAQSTPVSPTMYKRS